MDTTALGLGHGAVTEVHIVIVGSDEEDCTGATACSEAVDRYSRVPRAAIGM